MGQLITIDDSNWEQFTDPAYTGRAMGLIPRCYSTHPLGYLGDVAKPFDLPLIPRNEWKSRLKDLQDAKAQLHNIRDIGMDGSPIPSRDQGNRGYCWAHSSTSACLITRAVMGLPYADLSAYMVACIIKNFRNQGGWGAESLEFIADKGIATSKTWPQQGLDRSLVNDAMYAEAAFNRVTEWMDLEENNVDQYVTCLLSGLPVVADRNWWSHSTCDVSLVQIDPADLWGSFETKTWNSWSDSWSDNGMGNIKGRRGMPNGMVAPRVIRASAA